MAKNEKYVVHEKAKTRIRAVMHNANKINFTTVEDRDNASGALRKLAGTAVGLAARENRRHGLAAVVIRHNQVIRVTAKNEEEVIANLKQNHRHYKPGQVFYARKS